MSDDIMTTNKDNKTNINKHNNLQIYNTITATTILTNRPQTNNTRIQHNKLQHSLNGNHYLNIAHWNKGNTLFKNKTPQIDQILNTHKPHILSLCEANIAKMINDTLNDQYFDYKTEHTKMADTTNNSRNANSLKIISYTQDYMTLKTQIPPPYG